MCIFTFSYNRKTPTLNPTEYEILIDLASHSKLNMAIQNPSPPEFWCHLINGYSKLSLRKQKYFYCLFQRHFSVKRVPRLHSQQHESEHHQPDIRKLQENAATCYPLNVYAILFDTLTF